MAKKVLVLGAAGFIGSNIAKSLNENGYVVAGVDNMSFGSEKNVPDIVFGRQCISTLEKDLLNTFDVIVSSYCSNIIYAMDNMVETYINNIVNGIKCFSKFNGKIIYLSTSSVYGNQKEYPTKEDAEINLHGAYAISKHVMEQYLKQRGNFTTLRLSNVYGYNHRPENPYCGVINKFIYNKLTNNVNKISGGYSSSRDYTFVTDVVNALIKCIQLPAFNQEINIGTSTETTIFELAKMIGGDYEVIKKREIDVIERRCLDISKAKKLLGWEPKVCLEEGLKLTEQWIKENYVK